jgi:hypothetical protein
MSSAMRVEELFPDMSSELIILLLIFCQDIHKNV